MIHWVLLFFASMIAINCGNDSLTRGGGTNVGDEAALVAGTITDKNGPAAGALVLIHSPDFNPGKDKVLDSQRFITGSDGKYVFKVSVAGLYNIEASHPELGTKALLKGLRKAETKMVASDLQLQSPGQISVHMPDFLQKSVGYAYIPGTSIVAKVDSDSIVKFLSVPPLEDGKLVFSNDKDSSTTTLAEAIHLGSAGNLQVSKFNQWAHQSRIKINTALIGVKLGQNILNFPLLIRLNSENFAFSQANNDGSDLRFTSTDGITTLPFEIERWNSALSVAEIWVNIDTLFADSNSQTILMHSGKSDAPAPSNANLVFSSSSGFRSVWHLGENSTSSTVKDAAGNFNGILKSSETGVFTSSVSKSNIIGMGYEFKDWRNKVWIDLGGDQNFVNNQSEITLSLWASVRIDTANSPDVFALSVAGPISQDPKSRVVMHFEKGMLSILARAVDSATDMNGFNIEPGIGLEQWFYITGVMNIGLNTMEIYVNGNLLQKINTNHAQNTLASGNSTHGAIGSNDIGNGNYFAGLLDEVRLEVKARSPEWIKLCYENQKMDQVIVSVLIVR